MYCCNFEVDFGLNFVRHFVSISPDKVRQVRVVTLLRDYEYFKENDSNVDKIDGFVRFGDELETSVDDFTYPPLLLDKPIIHQVVDFVRSARGRGVSEVQA